VNRIAGNMLYLGGADSAAESGLIDLVELYGDLTNSVNVLTNGHTAIVDFVAGVNSIEVVGSRLVYERIVLNLLSNSLKATPKDGKITVSVIARGSKAIITVSDTGRGIPQDILPNLFSSYSVERSLSESYQSIGMGLAVVQGLVHSLSGTIMAVSEERKGTSVTVSIPVEKPKDLTLKSPSSRYLTKAIGILQTELSEVLDSDSYSDVFGD
jgi:signal transduction histidine kinase